MDRRRLAALTRAAALEARIERALVTSFGSTIAVVVRSKAQLASVIARAPGGFGAAPERYRYDVIQPCDAD